jgi:hypothetical protein
LKRFFSELFFTLAYCFNFTCFEKIFSLRFCLFSYKSRKKTGEVVGFEGRFDNFIRHFLSRKCLFPYLLLIPSLRFLFYSRFKKAFLITEHFQKHPLYFAIYLQVVISCDLWKIVFLAYIFSSNPGYSTSFLFFQVWHIQSSLSNQVIFE